MTVQDKIQEELSAIEKEFDVTVFYACESGSRAWGFESTDSDYDVRFLYYHKLDWYLSVDQKRDVIERPIDDQLDVSGWELRKALGLLRKSNPPLLEWLQSPIVYRDIAETRSLISELIPQQYSKVKSFYHYLSMAKGNYRQYLQGDFVRLKKYFYVLRPLLACQWVMNFDTPVPMTFSTLVNEIVKDQDLIEDIDELLRLKCSGVEMKEAPKVHSLNEFIERQLNAFEDIKFPKEEQTSFDELNRVFREIIKS